MWVRGQDKLELIKADRFTVNNEYIYTYNNSNGDCWIQIGVYSTKERAIEVLNEIQRELTHTFVANERQYITVYRMPQK